MVFLKECKEGKNFLTITEEPEEHSCLREATMVTLGAQDAKADYTFHKGRLIDPYWVLLDSKLTPNIFSNRNLLTSICKIEVACKINTAAGTRTTNLIRDLR